MAVRAYADHYRSYQLPPSTDHPLPTSSNAAAAPPVSSAESVGSIRRQRAVSPSINTLDASSNCNHGWCPGTYPLGLGGAQSLTPRVKVESNGAKSEG